MKKLHFILAGIGVIVSSISFVAVAQKAHSNDSALWLGGVDVQTKVYTLDADHERTTELDFGELEEGSVVDYIIEVENVSAQAYVRTKVSFSSNQHPILTDIADGWVYKGGYYYYTKPLARKESVVLCNKIKMPTFVSEKTDVVVSVDSEAVQAKNFTCDFTSNSPWGDVVVTDSDAVTDNSVLFTLNGEENVLSQFSNTVLFSNFDDVMPGDTIEDTVTLHTATDEELSFTSKKELSLSEKQYIKLQILKDDTLIYDGVLTDLENALSGELKEDTSYRLTFRLVFDKRLSNVSAWKNVADSIIVGMREIPEDTPTTEEITTTESTTTQTVTTEAVETSTQAQTGDFMHVIMLIFLLSVSSFIVIFTKGKKIYEE